MSGIGHNSSISEQRLNVFIQRIERLEEEKKALTSDIKEVYDEAKSAGFDTKIMRKVVAIRRMDEADRLEQQAIMEVYMKALGMLADTPLGQAALQRAG